MIQGKEQGPKSCFCIYCCFCWLCCGWDCEKKVTNLELRTYEDVIEEGWEDKHFMNIEFLLGIHATENDDFANKILNNGEFRDATAFYLETYHDTYVVPQYSSNTSSAAIE